MKKNENLLREFRSKAGLTQTEASLILGVNLATIQRRERGELPALWELAVRHAAYVRKIKLEG